MGRTSPGDVEVSGAGIATFCWNEKREDRARAYSGGRWAWCRSELLSPQLVSWREGGCRLPREERLLLRSGKKKVKLAEK